MLGSHHTHAHTHAHTHTHTHTHTSCARTRTHTAWRAPPASLTAAHPLWQAEEALRDAAYNGRDAAVQEGIAKGVDVNAGDSVSGRARQRESGEALCVGSIHPHAQHTSSDVLDRYKHRGGGWR